MEFRVEIHTQEDKIKHLKKGKKQPEKVCFVRYVLAVKTTNPVTICVTGFYYVFLAPPAEGEILLLFDLPYCDFQYKYIKIRAYSCKVGNYIEFECNCFC